MNIKKHDKGFTIIEVMIVLVIAAIILLIVFLAVPALQRSSRNNQRKNDIARINAAVSEFVANHGGNQPDDIDDVTNITGSLAFYGGGTLASNATVQSPGTESYTVVTHSTCNYSADPIVTAGGGANSRRWAVISSLEGAGSPQIICVDS